MKKDIENMDKKTRNNIFYKTNPRGGISLIVLVITIIVIIILAAAVIISLQNNNPMAEANRARYESDVSNMQMVFTNAIGKIMAEKQEIIGIKACQLNSVTKGVKSAEGEVTYTINGEDAGKIIFTNEPSENKNDYITGKKLPIYNSETIWNVDDEGILGVGVGKNTYPSNNSSGGSGTTGGGTSTTPDSEGNVTISREEYTELLEKVNKIDNIGQIYTKTNTINISKKGVWNDVSSATWTLPAGTWVIDFSFNDEYNHNSGSGIWNFYLTGIGIRDSYWRGDNDWGTVHFSWVKTFEKETTGYFSYYQNITDSPRNVDFTMYAVRIK